MVSIILLIILVILILMGAPVGFTLILLPTVYILSYKQKLSAYTVLT